MAVSEFDIVIIGAGPAGEVGAIRAAQLGFKVALVDKNQHLGGTCLNVGCIPTKALIGSANVYDKLRHAEAQGFELKDLKFDWAKIMGRKDKIVDQQRKGLQFLMKKNKVEVFHGVASLADKNTVVVAQTDSKSNASLKTKYILLATGSRVKELPFAKSDGKNILNSDEILSIASVPKTLVVIGGGVVGMEFASLFNRFGSQVTVIELAAQVLPYEDAETVAELCKYMKKSGVQIFNQSKLESLKASDKSVTVKTTQQGELQFEKVLLSIGREPVLAELNLQKLGITTEKGFVKVDDHYRTNVANIFAVGDIIATPALAHTASAEAKHAVEFIAGHKPQTINYQANPSAIYTYPEIASIGFNEETLKAKNTSYKVAKFPFAPMAKAKIDDATEGFVKILYEPKYKEILGVHIVNAKATELIAEFVLGKILETTVDEIGLAIHPHPTMSETCMEAAHVAEDGPIHM